MPFPFQAILIFGATSYILTAILFLITKNMPGNNSGIIWWSISSFAAALGYIALLIAGLQGRPDIGEALYNICFVVWGLGLYLGSRYFLSLQTHKFVLSLLSIAVIGWLFYFYFISYHFILSAIVISTFIGALNLHLAWIFLKNITIKNRFHYAIIISLVISGLHWLDYPFLRPIESIAPIGFSLCAIIAIVINSLFASLVIVQFKDKMILMSEEALKLANHDPLTGLGNRNALEDLFATMLEKSQRLNKRLALLFLDLDNFKPINDKFGHKIGDQVLVEVTSKISSLVTDSHHIARVGGDEFIIIVDELDFDDNQTIVTLCENIIKTVSQPITVKDNICNLGVCIGIAYSTKDIQKLDTLIHLSDEAMYKAKSDGKNKYIIAN